MAASGPRRAPGSDTDGERAPLIRNADGTSVNSVELQAFQVRSDYCCRTSLRCLVSRSAGLLMSSKVRDLASHWRQLMSGVGDFDHAIAGRLRWKGGTAITRNLREVRPMRSIPIYFGVGQTATIL